MKKITAVIAAIVALFMFSVNCFAVVVNDVDKPITSASETYSVNIFDQVDEDADTVYVSGSPIEIYKLASGGDTTGLQTENLYTTVNTDSEGKASVSLPAGSYIIKEGAVIIGSKKYTSQDIQFTIDSDTSTVEVYLKHSLVSDVTITEPATEEPTTGASVPFTGSQIAVGAIVALCIGVAVAAIVVVTKKKDKKTADDNTDTETK